MQTNAVRRVPRRRIMDKVDEYMGRRDYAGVERLLLYWLKEAEACRDDDGRLMVLGELIGHYRKTGDSAAARRCIESALVLLRSGERANTLDAATTLVNAATALHAFGRYEEALPLFEQAKALYGRQPDLPPELSAGLQNNMALTLVALGRYDEAFTLYRHALAILGDGDAGAPERAVTCLNMADAVAAQDGMEAGEAEIFRLLDEACALLARPGIPRDGYYAYVCEKCAPVLDGYGYFADAERLRRPAEEIYERP